MAIAERQTVNRENGMLQKKLKKKKNCQSRADILPETSIRMSVGETTHTHTHLDFRRSFFCTATHNLRWDLDNGSPNSCGFGSFVNRLTVKIERKVQ